MSSLSRRAWPRRNTTTSLSQKSSQQDFVSHECVDAAHSCGKTSRMPTIMHKAHKVVVLSGLHGGAVLVSFRTPTVLNGETPTNAVAGTCIPSDFTSITSVTVHEAKCGMRRHHSRIQTLTETVGKDTTHPGSTGLQRNKETDFQNRRADKGLLMNGVSALLRRSLSATKHDNELITKIIGNKTLSPMSALT